MRAAQSRWPIVASMVGILAIESPTARDQQPSSGASSYDVIDLGTLGGTFSIGQGINNKGWVAGGSLLPGDVEFHAVLWRDGQMLDLGTFGGELSSATDRISESGLVSGYAWTNIPNPSGDGKVGLPFLWRNGVMEPLPTLGGSGGGGAEVNNRGQVVGTAQTAVRDSTCVSGQFPETKPVIWQRGTVVELPTLPGDIDGLSLGINDAGVAVGTTGDCVENHKHVVLWQHGAAIDLGTLGGQANNEALGINNQGQVVGRSGLTGDQTFHAFLWQAGKMMDLGTLPGDVTSWGININSKGQVVGASCDANNSCRAVLWQNGVITDLNTRLGQNSGFVLFEADDINDRGQITGMALLSGQDEGHAYLATPVAGGPR